VKGAEDAESVGLTLTIGNLLRSQTGGLDPSRHPRELLPQAKGGDPTALSKENVATTKQIDSALCAVSGYKTLLQK
jgi:hypothetical protein